MYLPNPQNRDRMRHMVNFKQSYSWFEFSVLSKLVAVPKLKKSDCPTIYPYLEGEELDSCLSQ